MTKQQKGRIQAEKMAKAVGGQPEPKGAGGGLFKGKNVQPEADDLPRISRKDYESQAEEEEKPIEIIVPEGVDVVNQRIFCIGVSVKPRKDPKTGLYHDHYVALNAKDGTLRNIDRYLVAKCAPDIFIETKNGTKNVDLPPGTEVFPFFPDMENYSFPSVTIGFQRYTIFHWTELSAYKIPPENQVVKKK